ncbi:MAG TPA: ABC transporter permease [Candidatus Thermoplasmatota archaeon]|nr:ABC transporter permease [Candidatus Thermoplasmatota archaeon]
MVSIGKMMVNDMRNIIRDRILLYSAFVFPIVLVILCRLILPWISDNVYDLTGYYTLLFMMFTIFFPMIFGFIIAFLIMDERDENLLTVLRVMPISRTSYLLYRMFLIVCLCFIFVFLFPALSGLIDISFIDYLPIAVLFSIFAPVLALIVNNLASNKIQAFAIFKMLGSVFFLPLFSLFIAEDWKYILGIIPNFWTFMALDKILTTGNQDVVFLGIGFFYHILLLGILFYLFNKKY